MSRGLHWYRQMDLSTDHIHSLPTVTPRVYNTDSEDVDWKENHKLLRLNQRGQVWKTHRPWILSLSLEGLPKCLCSSATEIGSHLLQAGLELSLLLSVSQILVTKTINILLKSMTKTFPINRPDPYFLSTSLTVVRYTFQLAHRHEPSEDRRVMSASDSHT